MNHPFWGTPIFGNTHMVSTPIFLETKEKHLQSARSQLHQLSPDQLQVFSDGDEGVSPCVGKGPLQSKWGHPFSTKQSENNILKVASQLLKCVFCGG